MVYPSTFHSLIGQIILSKVTKGFGWKIISQKSYEEIFCGSLILG